MLHARWAFDFTSRLLRPCIDRLLQVPMLMRAPRRGSVTEIEAEEMVDNVPSSEDDDADHPLISSTGSNVASTERAQTAREAEEAFLADDTNHFATTMLKRSARNAKDPKVGLQGLLYSAYRAHHVQMRSDVYMILISKGERVNFG